MAIIHQTLQLLVVVLRVVHFHTWICKDMDRNISLTGV